MLAVPTTLTAEVPTKETAPDIAVVPVGAGWLMIETEPAIFDVPATETGGRLEMATKPRIAVVPVTNTEPSVAVPEPIETG